MKCTPSVQTQYSTNLPPLAPMMSMPLKASTVPAGAVPGTGNSSSVLIDSGDRLTPP